MLMWPFPDARASHFFLALIIPITCETQYPHQLLRSSMTPKVQGGREAERLAISPTHMYTCMHLPRLVPIKLLAGVVTLVSCQRTAKVYTRSRLEPGHLQKA